MIKSFKCKQTEKLFHLESIHKIPKSIQQSALRKLEMLDYAVTLNDLRVPPGNVLEALKGERRGQHSIRINKQWRLCFVWCSGHAYDVEIVDYH